ncbi:hypothetical protein CEUSTIGMA_g6819.t1 [Chlamydomonas eustigma]|uniref:Nuclear pore protein n=1 Tax=Chlamydomonas eustigma TaxID=1157962 RepID=A0A250X8I8_9CHLO|nr:hypothetical protein CEUSTIGMA_g6819.t1 [Chlamydomonas eustigma]|eukprot:GAX79377.1 hypothetical protein CEUSTIGMA_g6819.t1 [Chlamydomonas eustigma]
MTTTGLDSKDWQSLLNQTNDLVTSDYHQFPRVDRNIQQLQSYAGALRAKTNKFRTHNNQVAATRLLAQQGFDATRLNQEVSTLEIQPTIEDVFHADTSSVEEYLKQIEEATILVAIQEAQQETVASFEHFMEDCLARDWAASKKQLFGFLAPHSGVYTAPQRNSSTAGAAGFESASSGMRLPPKEQAYINVIQKANKAAAGGNLAFDLVSEFASACKAHEDKSHETAMSGCWSLLGDVLAEARTKAVQSKATGKFTEALLSGARKSLERGHAQHMRNMLLRHKLQAERGADPDQLREVQAFIQVKYGSKGPLDFQQPGGQDTSWIQVYFSMRNGWHDCARRAAERVADLSLSRAGGELGLKGLLDEWLRNGGKLSDRSSGLLARECERMLRDKAALKAQLRSPYMALVCALLSGDNRSVDALMATLASLSVPSVLSTIEDFMWCKLTFVGGSVSQVGTAFSTHSSLSGVSSYQLADLHADLNRWPATYYSKQGKEPLLYIMILLLSLQFQEALRFLWKDETTKMYRVDAVHMAIAMHQEELLGLSTATGGDAVMGSVDLGGMIQSYGQKFVHVDSGVALQYYMLASVVRGNSIAVKGQMLRELLTESRDFGTLLGGGGAAGSGTLAAYVPSVEERKQLFEAVAYECQVAGQVEEAVELYMAADRPRQALSILNQQLSSAMERGVEEAVSGMETSGAAEMVKRVMARGRDACTKLGGAGDAGSRREVEAFVQLNAIWEMLVSTRKGRHDLALQKLHELSFVPLERTRVESCARAAQLLHPAVQDRLQDILGAAAEMIGAQRPGSSRDKLCALRLELDALCLFANNISNRISQAVYQKLSEVVAAFS